MKSAKNIARAAAAALFSVNFAAQYFAITYFLICLAHKRLSIDYSLSVHALS